MSDRRFPLAGAALAIAAVAFWWPVLLDFDGRVAGGNGDPLLVAYLVTWVAGHLGDPALWNPPFFHPAANVLAYSEHMIGLGVLAWPAVVAGASPVVIVNTISVLASVLTALALYWWLRDSRFEATASAAAAVCITYGAWRLEQFAHPHQLFTPFIPVALLCFGRVIESRGSRWLTAVASAALVAQSLCAPSFMVYLLPLSAAWVGVGSWRAGRRDLQHWLLMGAAFSAVALANLPMAAHYWSVGSGITRDPIEIARFSVTWPDWMSVPPRHWLYGGRLAFTNGWERELFPGAGFLAVLGLGLWHGVRRRAFSPVVTASLATAALAIWASTGLASSAILTPLHLPYELLYRYFPGGQNIRVPARFVPLAGLFLAPVLAWGWQGVSEALRRTFSRRLAAAATFTLVAAVTMEGLASRAWYEDAPDLAAVAIAPGLRSTGLLFVPLAEAAGDRREIERMWLARLSGVPLVNGYSGSVSPMYARLRDLQHLQLDRDTQRALYSWLRHADVDTIIVDAPSPALVAPDLLERVADDGYRIPLLPIPSFDSIAMGHGLGLMAAQSGWSYPERTANDSWVWSTGRRATLLIPMNGSPRRRLLLRVGGLRTSDSTTVEVWWSGTRLGSQRLNDEAAVLAFALPEGATTAGWTEFEIVGPAPQAVPGSPDARRLSVRLFEIRVE